MRITVDQPHVAMSIIQDGGNTFEVSVLGMQGIPADTNLNWVSITNKPTVFPPSVHNHVIADVTGLQDSLNGKQAVGNYATEAQGLLAISALQPGAQIPWDDVTSKPLTFTPSAHDQSWATITSTPTSLSGYGISDGQPLDSVLTNTTASFTTAQETKLSGISDGAQVNVPTNLTYTTSTRLLASDTGSDATLPLMSSTEAGLVPPSGGGTTNFLRADGTFTSPGGGTVTDVTGTAPIVSSGGSTPAISIVAATGSVAGSMSAVDKTKLDTISGTNTGDQDLSGKANLDSPIFTGTVVLPNDTVTNVMIAGTGARDATTFYRGDGTFAAPAGGGGSFIGVPTFVQQTQPTEPAPWNWWETNSLGIPINFYVSTV